MSILEENISLHGLFDISSICELRSRYKREVVERRMSSSSSDGSVISLSRVHTAAVTSFTRSKASAAESSR